MELELQLWVKLLMLDLSLEHITCGSVEHFCVSPVLLLQDISSSY